jgi:glycosyltransferase involved in cell wall biosynthesis
LNFIYPYTPYQKVNKELITASWIPDFQHKYLPHLFDLSSIFIRDTSFKYISKQSPKVVVSSKSAETDFHKFFPDSKADVKILSFTTFPLPDWYTSERQEILSIYSLPQKFFLVSNQFWKHKNHEVVFRAISVLKSRGLYIYIVFTGKLEDDRHKGYAQEIRNMIDHLKINKQIYLLGLIPKKHQVQIMRSAIAMIQPSLFEGWSTVVEDARCFGKKIALSSIPVHLEQNPPDAAYFDKESPDELADILGDWWGSIDIGFDFDREVIARQNSFRQIEQIAYDVLNIAGIVV